MTEEPPQCEEERLGRLLAALPPAPPDWAEADGSAVEALAARSTERGGREQEIADIRLGDALALAADLPLRIVEVATDAAELGAIAAEQGSAAVRPDAVGACLLAAAAAAAAAHLVDVNLATRPADERIAPAGEHVALARAASERALAAPH